MASQTITRRPLKSRGTRWASGAAERLIRLGVRPNQVSVASVAFASFAAGMIYLAPAASPAWSAAMYALAAGSIQLRLLANLLDGLIAVEGGLGSRSGELYNEVPDRISDVLILVAAGYSISTIPWGLELGWVSAVLSVFTAYVRALGGSLGQAQDFCGPMAKPHRMAVMTAACLGGGVEELFGGRGVTMWIALAVIAAGTMVTAVRRIVGVTKRLQHPPHSGEQD